MQHPTGLSWVDRHIGGLEPGETLLIAGQPAPVISMIGAAVALRAGRHGRVSISTGQRSPEQYLALLGTLAGEDIPINQYILHHGVPARRWLADLASTLDLGLVVVDGVVNFRRWISDYPVRQGPPMVVISQHANVREHWLAPQFADHTILTEVAVPPPGSTSLTTRPILHVMLRSRRAPTIWQHDSQIWDGQAWHPMAGMHPSRSIRLDTLASMDEARRLKTMARLLSGSEVEVQA